MHTQAYKCNKWTKYMWGMRVCFLKKAQMLILSIWDPKGQKSTCIHRLINVINVTKYIWEMRIYFKSYKERLKRHNDKIVNI